MKKITLFSFLFFLVALPVLSQKGVQYDTSNSNLELVFVPKVGFATLSQSQQPKVNGFVNGGDVLAAFKLKNSSFLNVGVGYNSVYSNTTFNAQNASLNNTYLRIPVNYTSNFSFFKDKTNTDFVFLSAGIGFYANTLLKSDLETLSGNFSDKNLGWNFGFSTYIGAKFNLSDTFNLGLGLETNNDLTKMKKNQVEQKINNLTSVNLILGFKLH